MLIYAPGAEDAEMVETEEKGKATVVCDTVEEKPASEVFSLTEEEEDERESDDEEMLVIDEALGNAIANTVADVIVKNIEDPEQLSPEEISFIFEEVADAVESALLDECNFSRFNFDIWYSTHVGKY